MLLSRKSKFYLKCIECFKKQFDVDSIIKVHLNAEGRIIGGEWKDSQGAVNFNSGIQPDIHKTIHFED